MITAAVVAFIVYYFKLVPITQSELVFIFVGIIIQWAFSDKS